jgi:hypothetical protein
VRRPTRHDIRLTASLCTVTVAAAAIVLAACGSSSSSRTTATSGQHATGAATTSSTQAASIATADVVPPGDIPDNQAYIPYHATSARFTISYPEGWAKRQNGSTTIFSDKFNSMTLTTAPSAAAPTVASERDVIVPLVRSSTQQFQLRSIDTVTRPAGQAVRMVYRAVSGVDPVTGKTILLDVERYDFFHGGELVTVTLASPKGSDNVDPWRTITQSLRWA